MYGKRIRELRKQTGKTMKEFGKLFNLAESTISGYENETRKPDMDILQKFADYFGVSVDYLLGRTNQKKYYALTAKDERDIAKQLEKIVKNMDEGTALAFDGEPMDDNTKELVRTAIESNLRLTKQLAKKKFTPKKYRGNRGE